jgi:hypothetical protein
MDGAPTLPSREAPAAAAEARVIAALAARRDGVIAA